LTLSEWNELAGQIQDSPLQSPGALPGQSAAELSRQLRIEPAEGERLARLLDRAGRVALELDSLLSRGMWVVTRVDARYPAKLRNRLKHQAPTVLFGAGDLGLLARPGVAVVGSRNIDATGAAFAQAIGQDAVAGEWAVVSGGARGTDRLAMQAAVEAGGRAVGVLADSLEQTIRQPDLRQLLLDQRVALFTPYSPSAGFSVGGAMGRNKIIYGAADFAVVVSSEFEKGGTWAGAVDALKAKWGPVLVRIADGVPKGNHELIKKGALPLAEPRIPSSEAWPAWLREHSTPAPVEQDLFAFEPKGKTGR